MPCPCRRLAAGALVLALAALAPRAAAAQTVPPPADAAVLAAEVKAEFLHAWDGYTQLRLGPRRPAAAQPHAARLVPARRST